MPAIDTTDPAKFVNVYSSTTGEKVRVPAHWMEHPKLSRGLRKTPLQKAAEKRTAEKRPTSAPAAGDNTEQEM